MCVGFAAVVVIVFLLPSRQSVALEYYVAATNGSTCPSEGMECYNLSYYASQAQDYFVSDSAFIFLSGTHLLYDEQSITISNVSNLTLSSFSGEKGLAVIQCLGSGGIFCSSSTSLQITGITIQNCSLSPLPFLWYNLSAAITVTQTTFLYLESVLVCEGQGSGLLAFNVCNLTVIESNFNHNKESGLQMVLHKPVTFVGKNCSSSINQSWFRGNKQGLDVTFENVNSNISLDANNLQLINNDINLKLNSNSCSYSFCAENITSVSGRYGLLIDQTYCSNNSGRMEVSVQVRNSDFINSTFIGIAAYWQSSVKGTLELHSVAVNNTIGDVCVGVVVQEFPEVVTSFWISGFLLVVTNVTVQGTNSIILNQTGQVASGFLLVSLSHAALTNLSLINNVEVGLQLFDSSVIFYGVNVFCGNKGQYGGGMALYGSSYMVLDRTNEVSFKFEDNYAELYGGGIYVKPSYIVSVNYTYFSYCFLQLSNDSLKNIHFFFLNNTAFRAGHILYGGDIEHCHQWIEGHHHIDIIPLFLNDSVTSCANTSIASDGYRVIPCSDLCYNESFDTVRHTIPGENVSFSVAIVGQLNGITPGTIEVGSADIVLQTNHFHTTAGNCTNVEFVLKLADRVPELTVSLTLANGSYLDPVIDVTIKIVDCPLGFLYDSGTCVCAKALESNVVNCYVSNNTVAKKPNAWIGFDFESNCMYSRKYCPFNYCFRHKVWFNVSNGSDDQCQYDRAGILCGDCKEGLSLILGSNKCENCTVDVQDLNVPLIVLGCFFSGLCLIFFLTVLNITVSAGTMNGLIFFANVVKLYEPLFFPDGSTYFKYPIAWLNLELGIDACFYAGMESCGKMWLQFLFPFYLLGTLLVIVLLSSADQSHMLARALPSRVNEAISKMSLKVVTLMGSNAVPVLATLCLLLYTKVLRTIVLILYKVPLDCCDANNSDCSSSSRWYVNGTIEYLGGCHLPLVVFSVVVLFVFTAATLVMALGETILPLLGKRRWTVKLKPCFDAFGGPYNNHYRFWTAFLLVVRCMLALVLSINNNPLVSLDVLAYTCIFLIMLLVTFRVYSSRVLNVLEVWFVLSLLVMAYIVETVQDSDEVSIKTKSLVDGIVLIALAIFCTIVIYHIYLKRVWLKNFIRLVDVRHKVFQRKSFVNQMTEILTQRNESFIKSDGIADKELTIPYSIVTMAVDEGFREPLIDQ